MPGLMNSSRPPDQVWYSFKMATVPECSAAPGLHFGEKFAYAYSADAFICERIQTSTLAYKSACAFDLCPGGLDTYTESETEI